MTVTNDERREVAKRLRELPTDMYEVEDLWEMKGLDTCCKDQTDYYLIHFVLFGCFPADYMHPCDYEELHARLADIIEPEERTCHMVCDYLTDTVYCDVCGERFDSVAQYMAVVPDAFNYKAEYKDAKFCPNCGAKVVEE